jgi:kynurenine formamidase
VELRDLGLGARSTEGVCLYLSEKGLRELIETADLERALAAAGLDIRPGNTVLLYTDHYRRAFGTDDWRRGPGISTAAARWLGERKIAAFGVETMAPGVIDVSNKEVHHICGELGFTHYENMINLHQLIGRGASASLACRSGSGAAPARPCGRSRSSRGSVSADKIFGHFCPATPGFRRPPLDLQKRPSPPAIRSLVGARPFSLVQFNKLALVLPP